jgi:ABC-type lipoprotein export system ATPase subunit
MTISLQQVIPHPIKENYQANSDIWLNDIQFQKGKKYLITAPSGKGKSTFLHAVYGLRKDFDGTIQLENQASSTFKLNDWAAYRQHKLAIVFQDLRLFPQLTGMENILLKNNLKRHFTEQKIQEMATELGVASILNQSCGTMSYGQRQRIAIIRALSQPFDFLLLDEPFSHLDEENIKKASNLIQKVCEAQQGGLLFVSLGESYDISFDQKLDL